MSRVQVYRSLPRLRCHGPCEQSFASGQTCGGRQKPAACARRRTMVALRGSVLAQLGSDCLGRRQRCDAEGSLGGEASHYELRATKPSPAPVPEEPVEPLRLHSSIVELSCAVKSGEVKKA